MEGETPPEYQFIATEWHDYDFVYQFNDYMVEAKTCPGDWETMSEEVQDLSECKKAVFKRHGIRDDYLHFIQLMEVHYAGMKVPDGSELQQGTAIRSSVERFIGRFTANLTEFQNQQCQGFCQVPKHLIFSTDKPVGSDLQCCALFMIEYLIALVGTYSSYCMWHTKLCLFQLCFALLQYFKMPSLTSKYEEQKLKKEKSLLKKLFEQSLRNKDFKMVEVEKKRIREERELKQADEKEMGRASGKAGNGARARKSVARGTGVTVGADVNPLDEMEESLRQMRRSKRASMVRSTESQKLNKRISKFRQSQASVMKSKDKTFDSGTELSSSGSSDDTGSSSSSYDLDPVPSRNIE